MYNCILKQAIALSNTKAHYDVHLFERLEYVNLSMTGWLNYVSIFGHLQQ